MAQTSTSPATAPFAGPLAAAWGATTPERVAHLLPDPGSRLPRVDLRPSAAHRGPAVDPGRPEALRELLRTAESERGTPWPQPTASTWARVRRDGNRTAHEELLFTHTHRTTRAVLAAAVHPDDDALLDEVADAVLLRCEQSSWCWPAHDDTATRRGELVPDLAHPSLDLGAGEVAGQLAWADHLLGGRLDRRWPGVRARVRREVRARVLDPFLARRDWHWLGLDGDVHNWNPWIHQNVVTAALALLDGPEEVAVRAEVVALALQGVDRYVAMLPDDGGVDEGFDYWFNGACRALEVLDLVRSATGGALDWTLVPRLRATTGFPHAMHLGGPWHASFADARARAAEGLPWHALHSAAVASGDVPAQRYAASSAVEVARRGDPVLDARAGLGRLAQELVDEGWWAARAAAPAPPLPRSAWFPSLQVFLARRTAGSAAGTAFALKGGHDDEHHNHCDVGSLVVALDGVPVVVDPGRPTYTAATFGPHRYDLWTMGSAWHSVPQPGGLDQIPGREQTARDVVVGSGGDEVSMDLAAAYPGSGVRRWERAVRLDRVRDEVVLTDAWETDGPAGAVHLVLAGRVVLEPGRARVDLLEGAGTAILTWDPAAVVGASLEVRTLDDPMLTEVWGDRLTRLRLDLPAVPRGRLRVVVAAATGLPEVG